MSGLLGAKINTHKKVVFRTQKIRRSQQNKIQDANAYNIFMNKHTTTEKAKDRLTHSRSPNKDRENKNSKTFALTDNHRK